MHRKKDTFQYIPLEKSLKSLLKNKVCDEVSLFAICNDVLVLSLEFTCSSGCMRCMLVSR